MTNTITLLDIIEDTVVDGYPDSGYPSTRRVVLIIARVAITRNPGTYETAILFLWIIL